MLSKKIGWTSIILGGFLTTILLTGKSFAETSAPTISGYIDATYNYNFNKPYTQTNELRSFDTKANSFLMNAAQLQLAGTLGDAGYVVKLLAGTDAGVIKPPTTGDGTADDFALQEAYLNYKCPITGFTVKGGKFVTTEGIEVIESKDDPTISRGYLFGLAEPFTHTGLLLGHSFGKADLGVGLVNGWDLTSDNNSSKTMIWKAGYNFGDPLSLLLSGTYGSEQAENTASTTTTVLNGVPTSVNGNTRSSVDIVLVSKIIPKVTLNIQGNIGSEKGPLVSHGAGTNLGGDDWKGAGIQPIISVTDKFSIGSRLEYFYNHWGTRVANGTYNGTTVGIAPTAIASDHLSLTNFTITPSYKLTDSTTFRLEYRYDKSNDKRKVFTDDKGVLKANSSTVSAQFLLTF